MDWVQRGVAPGAIPAPIISLPGYSTLIDQTAAPYDALAPVRSAPAGLNSHYDYLGHYQPGPA